MSNNDRQKQIDIIARSFSMQSHAGDPRSFSEGIELGFKAGAAWADRNPANKWHDASEKPILHKPILIQCGYPLHTYEATALSEDVIWGDFVVLNAIFRWAYVKDLLPKGGEK